MYFSGTSWAHFLHHHIPLDLGQTRLCKITEKRRFGSPTAMRLCLYSLQLNHHFKPSFCLHMKERKIQGIYKKNDKTSPWNCHLITVKGFLCPFDPERCSVKRILVPREGSDRAIYLFMCEKGPKVKRGTHSGETEGPSWSQAGTRGLSGGWVIHRAQSEARDQLLLGSLTSKKNKGAFQFPSFNFITGVL